MMVISVEEDDCFLIPLPCQNQFEEFVAMMSKHK